MQEKVINFDKIIITEKPRLEDLNPVADEALQNASCACCEGVVSWQLY